MWISYLPDDLLALVLVRLPPKTLAQFKSVLKSWNALISSPQFIKMHLINQHRIIKKPNIIVKKTDRDKGARTRSEQIHVLNFSIVGKSLEVGCEIQRLQHPFERLNIDKKARIVGTCNGLLCQILGRNGYSECGITLCNPLTKLSWKLPKRPGFVNDQNQKKMSKRRISCYGFGYDDVHDDYKVMIASSRPYSDTGLMNILEYEYEYEFEVYSLRSDSWSRVRSNLDSRYYSICQYYLCSDGVLLNSALHWILRNNHPLSGGNKHKNSILAFDLRTDKHKILPVPEVLEESNCLRLSVLNGCLVLSYDWKYYFGAVAAYSYDLWVYGLKDSVITIPIYNLRPCGLRSLTPVALFGDNNHKVKLIFYDLYRGLMLLYDCVSRQIQQFPAPGGFDYVKQFESPFVGSLVQPYPPSNMGTVMNTQANKHSFIRRSQRLEEARKRRRN